MKDFVSFFLLLIIGTIFYIYLETKSLDVKYVKSTINNREYLVRNLPDALDASNLLPFLNNGVTSASISIRLGFLLLLLIY